MYMPFLRPLRPQESQIGNQPSSFISGWISRISSALISISLNPFSFSIIFAIFLVFIISCGRSGSRTRTEPVSGRAGGSCPPWVPKNQKSYESRITAIKCGEGESNPSTRFTDKRPDLPLAGPSLLSAGAGLSRLSIDNYVWYMYKAHHCGFAVKKGLEPFTAHSISVLPVQATPPVSLPFQAGLPSRACLSMFCVKVTVSRLGTREGHHPCPGNCRACTKTKP